MALDIKPSLERLKKLPPLALVGIVGGGIAIGYIVKHKIGAPKDDGDTPVQINDVTPDNLVALQRQNVDYGTTAAVSADPDNIDARNTLSQQVADLTAKLAATTSPDTTAPNVVATSPPSGQMTIAQALGSGGLSFGNYLDALSNDPAAIAAVQQGNTNIHVTAPVAAPATPVIQAPIVAPTPANKTQATKYPGLPDDYQLNCILAYKGLHGTYDQVYAGQAQKAKTPSHLTGADIEFLARNMSQIAVAGYPKCDCYAFDCMNELTNECLNHYRVFSGLYPLTSAEFAEMRQDMLAMSGPLLGGDPTKTAAQGGSKQFHDVFHSGVYARTLFNKWNYPYQCEHNAPARRDVGAGLNGY